MSRSERDDLWDAIGAPREQARWPNRKALEDDVVFLRGGDWDDITLFFEGATAIMHISPDITGDGMRAFQTLFAQLNPARAC